MGSRLPLATPSRNPSLLGRAVDDEFMLKVFQRELPALADVPIHVTDCKASAVKSRKTLKRQRLMVVYRVTIETPSGERREQQLLGTLPVEASAINGEFAESSRAAEGHPALAPFQRSAAYIGEIQMAVSLFPLDPALPALLELTRPEADRLISPFIAECRDGATIEQYDWELRHYKPSNRCVLRLVLDLAQPDGRRIERAVYAKIFADDRGEANHLNLLQLWQATLRCQHLRVPEPLGYDSRLRMLVMSEAPGERDLINWIKCLEKEQPLPPGVDYARVERCIQVAAAGMVELHRADLKLDRCRTFRDELAQQFEDLELMRDMQPELAGEIEVVLRRLEDHAFDDDRPVPSHGGFRHKQTVGDDRTLMVLDWDGLTLADAALDAATFLVRLRQEPLSRPGRARPMEQLAEFFRQEFLRQEPEVAPSRLALFEALVLLEQALRSFRRPGRRTVQIRNLVAAARQRLDEGVP